MSTAYVRNRIGTNLFHRTPINKSNTYNVCRNILLTYFSTIIKLLCNPIINENFKVHQCY